LVVKNGSKTRSRISGVIPVPSSAEPGLLPPDAMYERALRWTLAVIAIRH